MPSCYFFFNSIILFSFRSHSSNITLQFFRHLNTSRCLCTFLRNENWLRQFISHLLRSCEEKKNRSNLAKFYGGALLSYRVGNERKKEKKGFFIFTSETDDSLLRAPNKNALVMRWEKIFTHFPRAHINRIRTYKTHLIASPYLKFI